jgi:N-acyl-D-amino-acid deacylase
MKERVDMVIRNGLVFDGTGSEPFEGDIGISGDRIVFIDKHSAFSIQHSGIKSNKVIDAKGLTVAPGFIDTHAHSDFTLLADPRAEGKVYQGITTEINGNCGFSAAPIYGEVLKNREEDLKELGIRERWSTFKEYFGILEKRGITINFATLVGHGSIKACITGYQNRKILTAERRKMRVLIKKSIDDGAIGISTGLIYSPGVYSDTGELIEMARCCNKLVYTSHMRSEGDTLIESIEEIIRIADEAGVNVHISHIKTSGEKNWQKIDNAISMIEKAREEGIRITCDRYPYTAASTDLDTILPSWIYDGGADEELNRLKNPKVQEIIKREILYEHPQKQYWANIHISSVSSEKNRWMEGKSIASIAYHENSEPVDMLFKILLEEKLRIDAIFSSMNEDNLKRFLSLPYIMIGTDSSARCTSGPTHKGKPHPRGFGSFPRFLGRYIRNKGLMSLSKAIHKITMLPAKTFGIRKRGILKKDAFADIVVFDYEKLIDRATFDEPFLKPEGIYYVIANGLPALWEQRLTGFNTGRILKHGL